MKTAASGGLVTLRVMQYMRAMRSNLKSWCGRVFACGLLFIALGACGDDGDDSGGGGAGASSGGGGSGGTGGSDAGGGTGGSGGSSSGGSGGSTGGAGGNDSGAGGSSGSGGAGSGGTGGTGGGGGADAGEPSDADGSCPEEAPRTFGDCVTPNLECEYEDVEVDLGQPVVAERYCCACSVCGGESYWGCYSETFSTGECPSTPPEAGTGCTEAGATCHYCAPEPALFACQSGSWTRRNLGCGS